MKELESRQEGLGGCRVANGFRRWPPVCTLLPEDLDPLDSLPYYRAYEGRRDREQLSKFRSIRAVNGWPGLQRAFVQTLCVPSFRRFLCEGVRIISTSMCMCHMRKKGAGIGEAGSSSSSSGSSSSSSRQETITRRSAPEPKLLAFGDMAR